MSPALLEAIRIYEQEYRLPALCVLDAVEQFIEDGLLQEVKHDDRT